jgi:hypothetical protein
MRAAVSHAMSRLAAPPATLADAHAALVGFVPHFPIATPTEIAFEWRGRPVTCRVADGENGPEVTVKASLGRLPYSAENRTVRALILAAIGACPQSVRTNLTTSAGHVRLESATLLDDPVSLTNLLTAASITLLHVTDLAAALDSLNQNA